MSEPRRRRPPSPKVDRVQRALRHEREHGESSRWLLRLYHPDDKRFIGAAITPMLPGEMHAFDWAKKTSALAATGLDPDTVLISRTRLPAECVPPNDDPMTEEQADGLDDLARRVNTHRVSAEFADFMRHLLWEFVSDHSCHPDLLLIEQVSEGSRDLMRDWDYTKGEVLELVSDIEYEDEMCDECQAAADLAEAAPEGNA